jgi:hypothetical protein
MFKPAPPGIAIFCPLACFCQPQEVLAGAAPPSWLAPDLLRVALA